jgi:azurin
MGYATKEFTVKAGQTIKLTLDNSGATVPQPHNFCIAKAGPKEPLLAAAMKAMTDPQGLANGYVPNDPMIIAHTKLLQPGQKETIEFSLPAPGEYPFACTFPGHSILMNGVMKAQ